MVVLDNLSATNALPVQQPCATWARGSCTGPPKLKAAARTYDQLWAAVGQVCDLFSDEECYNYFKAAEYEAD